MSVNTSTPDNLPPARAKDLVGDALPALTKRRDGPGWCYFIGHLLATALSAYLLWLSDNSPWWPIAMLLHGTVTVHWFAPFHEAAHFTVFQSRPLNRALGVFSGYIVWLPFDYFVLEHRQHHLYTNLPEQDSEYIPHAKSRAGWWLYASALPYFFSLFSAMARYPLANFTEMEQSYLKPQGMLAATREMRIMVLLYIGMFAAAALTGWLDTLLWYWVLPRIVAEPLMRVIRLSEHGGCAEVPDMLRNTRTVLAMPLVRQLNWNMCFHAEHHALASVPFHQLPQAHTHLKARLQELSPSYLRASSDTLHRAS